MNKVRTVAKKDNKNMFSARADPIADAAHKAVDVVSPCMLLELSLNASPAPINPKPAGIAANILAIADLSSVRCEATATNKQEAIQRTPKVRTPASLWAVSLSKPIIAPKNSANNNFPASKSSNFISILHHVI